jgi:hypothetical protein
VGAECLARACTENCAEVATWACDGVCAVDACVSGHVDLDLDPRSGCEYACAPTTPGPELCDGEDNDCAPATPDGSGEATFGDDCDGADAGECEEGMVACNGTSLFCTDVTGDDVEGPFPARSCVGTVDEDCDGLADLADPDCDTGYGYRRPITIAAISVSAICAGPLSSFPVLVQATGSSSFRTTGNGGRLHSPSAFDLTFWAVADAVCGAGMAPCKLDHEIERWSGLTGDLVAWVRLPSLRHDAPTTFYVYYGRTGVGSSPQNATGVWEPNFAGVWHLGETSGGSNALRDSTTNANHATDVGSPSLAQTGKVGNAVNFDGSASYLRVSDGASLHLSAGITIEAWVFPDTTKDWATVASKFSGTTTGDLYWVQNTSELDGVLEPVLANSAGGFLIGALPIGAWSYVALSYNGTTARQMVNGTQVDSASVTGTLNLGTNTNDLYIGHNTGWTDEKFDGRIDELRISRVGRGRCWMETSFNTQNAPGTFASIGAEEAL